MRFLFLFPVNLGALANVIATVILAVGVAVLALLIYFEAYLGYVIIAAALYAGYRLCVYINRVGYAKMEEQRREYERSQNAVRNRT
jgi:fatty acid desaturase